LGFAQKTFAVGWHERAKRALCIHSIFFSSRARFPLSLKIRPGTCPFVAESNRRVFVGLESAPALARTHIKAFLLMQN
jgi:hypothetical protein